MLNISPYNHLPLDASDINFRMQHLRAFELIDMIGNNKLDIFKDDPSLCKYLDTWDELQKSLFIESLMLDFPIPAFYFDGSLSRWKIIDGIKRILAIYNFISGAYQLTGLDYYAKEAENCFYDGLPGHLRNRIRNAEFVVYIINPGTPLPIRYNLFKRINTTGLKKEIKGDYSQYGTKIRNIFFRGKVNGLIRKLDRNTDFRAVTKNITVIPAGNKVIRRREYISLFIAFQIMGVNSNCGNLEEYVSTALLLLYQQFDNYEEKLLFAFAKSMERMHKLSLDTLHHLETGRYRLLFNALATNLVELSDEEYDKLKDQASSFLSDYKAMARPIHFKREAFSLFNEIYNIINKYIQ